MRGRKTDFNGFLGLNRRKAERGKKYAPPVVARAFAELNDEGGVLARRVDLARVIALGELFLADAYPCRIIGTEVG